MKILLNAIVLFSAAVSCSAAEKVSGVLSAGEPAKKPLSYYGKQLCARGKVGAPLSKTGSGKETVFAARLSDAGGTIMLSYAAGTAIAENNSVIACGIFKKSETAAGAGYSDILVSTSIVDKGAKEKEPAPAKTAK
ncbi:MAG: hypothetical protein WCS77_07690 [Elusimicrobiaceae bacterium]